MTRTWCQTDIDTADAGRRIIAVHVAPALDRAARLGLLDTWWYIHKRPTWRVRFRTATDSYAAIGDVLTKLADDGRISGWRHVIYEPETITFGGVEGMDVAHQLFHADSHHLLAREHTAVHPLGPRETATLLSAVLLRGAGLDRFEHADVWAQVAKERPIGCADPIVFDEHRRDPLVRAMRRLLTADPTNLCPAQGAPLAGHEPWIVAFQRAGQALATLARAGHLRRGLRAVLAHHIIFHANRAGVSVPDLSTIAALAMIATFGPEAVAPAPPGSPPTTKVPQMTTVSDQQAPAPEALRHAMTERLNHQQVIRTPALRDAFRAVPRHLFIPHVPADAAYADEPVYTKTAGDGAKISAASQPRIVATMLEQLAPQPSEKIMEVGAGTGYNAALMAHMVGPAGHVTTIDVDEDLVTSAVEHLTAATISNVDVVLGDGALGHPASAPYDKIIATVGVWEVPTPWLDQLAADGSLVVPVRLCGAASRSIVFTHTAEGWRGSDSQLAVFMPLRGVGDDARRMLALNPEQDITLQINKDQNVNGGQLTGILDTPPHTVWTGVIFPPMVPFEWIELWLALRLPNSIMRMNTAQAAITRGDVDPMFPSWGAMATVQGPDLAYLTLRPASPVEGQKRYEIGVIGHGPGGVALAERVATEATTWDARFRDRTVRFELPITPTTGNPDEGRFTIDRPTRPISVIWQ